MCARCVCNAFSINKKKIGPRICPSLYEILSRESGAGALVFFLLLKKIGE